MKYSYNRGDGDGYFEEYKLYNGNAKENIPFKYLYLSFFVMDNEN